MGLLLLCFLLDLLAALHICSARGVAVAFRERDCCYLRFRVRLLAFLVVANLVLFCLFLLDQIFSTKFLVSKHQPAIPLAFTGFFTLAITLSLLIFIGEAVRDALDPRKTFQ